LQFYQSITTLTVHVGIITAFKIVSDITASSPCGCIS